MIVLEKYGYQKDCVFIKSIYRKVILTIVILTCSMPMLAQTGKIIVQVSGIKDNKGNIQIGLFNKEVDFMEVEEIYKGVILKSKKGYMTYTFTDIPSGTYAVSVFHDRNSNRKLDKNFLGIPTEEYGFSLNKYGTFGPPKFEKVSFMVKDKEDIFIKISLNQ